MNGLEKIGRGIFYLFLVACLSLNLQGQDKVLSRHILSGVNSNEYYYALGEATKLYLFGNFPQAVNLYNECIKINPSSSASHYQLAKIYMQAGELKLAREHARKAVNLDPDNPWYLQELAELFQIGKELDSAVIMYEKQLSKDPENLNILFMIASLYERVDKYDESLAFLNRIDEKIGISKETAITRFRIFEAMNQEQKALEQLRTAVQLSENEYSLTGMLAEFFRNHNAPDSALYYYKMIFPAYQDDPAVSFSYTEFLLELKQYRNAAEILTRAMTSDAIDDLSKAGYMYKIIQDDRLFNLSRPILDTVVSQYYAKYYNDLRSVSVFTDIEFRLGNYLKSSQALKRIVNEDNSNYPAYEQLIFSENALGHEDSVLKYSNIAIGYFPDKPVPYLFAGSVLYQKEMYDQAIILLEKGLILSEAENLKLEFFSLLAESYERKGQYEKSEESFKKALSIDPENLGISNNYAYYLALRSKNMKYARLLSKKTIEAEPDNSTYLDTYGWILYKMGKLKGAKRFIAAAISKGGEKNFEILKHYGEILLQMKKETEAIGVWKRALNYADNKEKSELEAKIKEIEIQGKR
ncbi:MAG: tetratricopeptide repeat protein [Bacteroidales bacterium]|nr:tetratricopeptide repeat protein [Bacteroidales bacterium]